MNDDDENFREYFDENFSREFKYVCIAIIVVAVLGLWKVVDILSWIWHHISRH